MFCDGVLPLLGLSSPDLPHSHRLSSFVALLHFENRQHSERHYYDYQTRRHTSTFRTCPHVFLVFSLSGNTFPLPTMNKFAQSRRSWEQRSRVCSTVFSGSFVMFSRNWWKVLSSARERRGMMCSVCLEGSTKRERWRDNGIRSSLSLIYPLSHTFVFRILPHSCQTLTSIRCTTVLFSLLSVSPYSFTSVPFWPQGAFFTYIQVTCPRFELRIQISFILPLFSFWSTAYLHFSTFSEMKILICTFISHVSILVTIISLPSGASLSCCPPPPIYNLFLSLLTIPHIPPISDTSNTLFFCLERRPPWVKRRVHHSSTTAESGRGGGGARRLTFFSCAVSYRAEIHLLRSCFLYLFLAYSRHTPKIYSISI